jgi:hypothetical protein
VPSQVTPSNSQRLSDSVSDGPSDDGNGRGVGVGAGHRGAALSEVAPCLLAGGPGGGGAGSVGVGVGGGGGGGGGGGDTDGKSSITDTVSSCELATKTRLVTGLTAMPKGPEPTGTVSTTVSVVASMTETLLPSWFVTYTRFMVGLTATAKEPHCQPRIGHVQRGGVYDGDAVAPIVGDVDVIVDWVVGHPNGRGANRYGAAQPREGPHP